MIWRGQIIGYRLLPRRRKVTVGPSKRATFVDAAARRAEASSCSCSRAATATSLHLAPELKGELTLGGTATPVADVASRDVDLAPRRQGQAGLRRRQRPAHRDPLGRPARLHPAAALPRSADGADHRRHQHRAGRAVHPADAALGEDRAEAAAGARRQPRRQDRGARGARVREEGDQEDERGRGREDRRRRKGRPSAPRRRPAASAATTPPRRTPSSPRGRKTSCARRSRRSASSASSARDKAPGSGLSKLFAQNNDVEQAMAGMAGAKMVVGHGAGGLTTSGSGSGGGGTGYGHIYGAGNLDTGGRGTHGHGTRAQARRARRARGLGRPGHGRRRDRRLALQGADLQGRASAHVAGVKYCYEKELQHKASLAGNIDIFWVIQPDGTVSKANVKSSAMNDAAVEGCIVRQVKQWQFPKAPGQTIVGRYPVHLQGRVMMQDAAVRARLRLWPWPLLAPLALGCQGLNTPHLLRVAGMPALAVTGADDAMGNPPRIENGLTLQFRNPTKTEQTGARHADARALGLRRPLDPARSRPHRDDLSR